MFAKHLMGSFAKTSGKATHTPSDVGTYVTGNYVTYELDRSLGTLFRTVAPFFENGQLVSYDLTGVGSDRTVLIGKTSAQIRLALTDASGPTSDVGSYARPAATISALYGRSGACLSVQNGSTYSLQHVDLATGTAYPAFSVPRLELWNSGDDLFAGNALVSPAGGTFWFTLLAASGGRHARARVPVQIHENAPAALFLRLRAAATPEPVTFAPFQRPMTTGTRNRGITVTSSSTYPGVRQPRANKSVAAHAMVVREVELGPSSGTVTLDGQQCTKHVLTAFRADLIGFLKLSKAAGVEFVTTRRTDYVTARDVLQYLDASGNPTGEFVFASTGVWASGQWLDTVTGDSGYTPYLATVRNLICSGATANAYVALDYEGAKVSDFMGPVLNGRAASFTCLPNLDWLIVPVDLYSDTTCSADLGKTWQPVTFWGPRGSTVPNPKPINQQELAEVGKSSPLFLT